MQIVAGGVVELVPLQVQLRQVWAEVYELAKQRHRRPVEGVVLKPDLLHHVLLHVVGDQLVQLLQFLVCVLQPIEVQGVAVFRTRVALHRAAALELVRCDLEERPHLPCLAHLDLFVQRHVLIPQGREHAVGALQILQVGIRLCLRCVHHLEDMTDFLHKHRHGIPRLLRAEQEFVDLQALDEPRLGLDEDGLRPARLVEHVFPLDVVELGLERHLLGLDVVEVILDVCALLRQLRVGRGRLAQLVLAPSQLVLERALVLLVAIDARGQIVVLRLQRAGLVPELLEPLLHLLLRLERKLLSLLQHAVLLLEQRLHLRRAPRLRLRL
mmetsp:Transcript_55058/g.154506  ORF Transcript_55058/g.154506 Transcript_55058/m.154506 type:complete len:326 (-) Transcript_55058:1185-2162(-)